MSTFKKMWLGLLCSLGLSAATMAFAQTQPNQDSALLDLLLKKGIVTDQEATTLRADLAKQAANSSNPDGATNLAVLSPGLTKLRLWGDLRLRMEDRTATEAAADDHIEMDRFRYRLRLGLLGDLTGDWSFGLRLDTNSNDRSSNVTLGTNNTTTYGPWSKGDDSIYLDQVYTSYKPGDWTFTLGRMPLPLTTTNLVWYQDMAPEGANEQFKTSQGALDYKVNLAQFIYGSPAFNNNIAGQAAGGSDAPSRDIILLAWQAGLKYNVNSTDFVQISPVLYNYVNNAGSANPTPFNGVFSPSTATLSQQAVNNLNVIEIPVEYDTMSLAPKLVRFFGDFAYNTEATGRADHYGRPDLAHQDLAYQIGVQYGKATKAGEWEAKAYWEQIDLFAIDPNLTDPDITDSLTNLKGFALNASYYLTDAVFIGATISDQSRADDNAPTGGDSQDTKNPGISLSRYMLYQLDLNIKF